MRPKQPGSSSVRSNKSSLRRPFRPRIGVFKPAALMTQASYIMKIPDLNYKSKEIIPCLVNLTAELGVVPFGCTLHPELRTATERTELRTLGSVLVESAERFQ